MLSSGHTHSVMKVTRVHPGEFICKIRCIDVTAAMHVEVCSVAWIWILVTRQPSGGHGGRLGIRLPSDQKGFCLLKSVL